MFPSISENPAEFLSLHLVSLIIPHLLTIYMLYNLFILFIPIMGRLGTEVNSDIVVAVLNSIVVIMLTSYLVSFVMLTSLISMVTIYMLYSLLTLFIMGRLGTEVNSDIVVAVLNSLVAFYAH